MFSILKSAVFYPWGALWYLLALIVAIILLYPFYKHKNYLAPVCIGIILYCFALISNSYYFIIENTFLQKVIDCYNNIFLSSRNGLFVGLLFVSIGVYIANLYLNGNRHKSIKHYYLLTLGFIILIFETQFIRYKHYIDDNGLFVSLPLIISSLINIIINFTNSKKTYFKTIRNLSTGMYFIHRPILSYLNYFFSLSDKIGYGIELFFIITLISFITCYLLKKLNNRYINLVIS